jgi:hypothetical protein
MPHSHETGAPLGAVARIAEQHHGVSAGAAVSPVAISIMDLASWFGSRERLGVLIQPSHRFHLAYPVA